MLAVGHLALGYLSGKLSARALGTRSFLPLLLTLAILPDMDFLIPSLPHRGPFHSFVVQGLCFLPFLLMYRRRAVPYFLALTSHNFADILGWEKAQLLYPVTSQGYRLDLLSRSTIYSMELTLYLVAASLMILDREVTKEPSLLNVLLVVPITALYVPLMLGYWVPAILVLPHIAFILLCAFAIGNAVLQLFSSEPEEPSLHPRASYSRSARAN